MPFLGPASSSRWAECLGFSSSLGLRTSSCDILQQVAPAMGGRDTVAWANGDGAGKEGSGEPDLQGEGSPDSTQPPLQRSTSRQNSSHNLNGGRQPGACDLPGPSITAAMVPSTPTTPRSHQPALPVSFLLACCSLSFHGCIAGT